MKGKMETYFSRIDITDSLFYLGIPYNPPTLSLSRAIPLKSRSRGSREEISGAWRRVRKPRQVCKSNRLRCWYVVNPHLLLLLLASLVFFPPPIFLTLSFSLWFGQEIPIPILLCNLNSFTFHESRNYSRAKIYIHTHTHIYLLRINSCVHKFLVFYFCNSNLRSCGR